MRLNKNERKGMERRRRLGLRVEDEESFRASFLKSPIRDESVFSQKTDAHTSTRRGFSNKSSHNYNPMGLN